VAATTAVKCLGYLAAVATEVISRAWPRFRAALIKGTSYVGVRGLRATQAAQIQKKHPLKIKIKNNVQV
jgi:hypothetical protein